MKTFAILGAALALATLTIDTAEARGGRFVRENPAGGVTAGAAYDHTGPNGGRKAGARGVITDGEGNGAGASGSCAEGEKGRGCRGAVTTWSADGTIDRKSGFEAEGANGGTASSDGTFHRNADGTYAGDRTTTATGENGTYNANTTYDSANGVARTVTCTDAAGAVIACPTR